MTYTPSSPLLYALACLTTLATLTANQNAQELTQKSKKPNVILIITDDQGYGDVHAHGNTMIRTPNIDKLSQESVRLTDFHVDPTCSPTRSALMSGRYSTRTGVWHTIMGRSLMSPNEVTLGETFSESGYDTAMFGKWHLGDNYPLRPQDQGFAQVVWHHGGGVGQGPDYWGNDYFDDTYEVNGKWQKFAGYCTDVWFEQATAWIEKKRGKPFFAYISTNAPHGPFYVAESYSKPYTDAGVPATMAKFYGMITNIDEKVGRLRKRLEELKLADNTILIFMTDNGTAAGDRARKREKGKWKGFNAGMRGKKGSEYEGGHRVPFYIHWPKGKLMGGRDIDTLSAHIDVLPTLADLCDLNPIDHLPHDGRSLAAALRGNAESTPKRTLFVHSQRIEHPRKWRKSAVMTKRWRLINGKELYDITADPGQRQDLAKTNTETVASLRKAYEAWWKSLSPGFDQYVRIGIGGAEDPVDLMSHDWHTSDRGVPWNQGHIKSGYVVNGPWKVTVEQAGEYIITLTRWPGHLDRAMNCTAAKLACGEHHLSRSIKAEANEVTFKLHLKAGPCDLLTTLTRVDGTEHGAYYASIRRLR